MNFNVKNHVAYKVFTEQTEKQTVIVEEAFDQEFHTKLFHSNGIVTASVFNYLDELQEDYNNTIVFEIDKQAQEVQAVNGNAEIEFSSTVSGDYTIKTNNPNFRNGEVVIHVE